MNESNVLKTGLTESDMVETGMVRRMDSLGRIVIPKDVRIKFGLREGIPLEISYNDKVMIFKPIGEFVDCDPLILSLVNALHSTCGIHTAICDCRGILAANCEGENPSGQDISEALFELIGYGCEYLESRLDPTVMLTEAMQLPPVTHFVPFSNAAWLRGGIAVLGGDFGGLPQDTITRLRFAALAASETIQQY